jgi:opacity protein-like surface antigen
LTVSPHVHRQALAVVFAAVTLMAPCVSGAQEVHPAMEAKWWLNLGGFLSAADFEAKANGSIAGVERELDFEQAFGFEDHPSLFMGELGWQFSNNWGVALQYFSSSRDGSRILEEQVEWQDDIFEVGARLDATAAIEVTRFFFSRRFRDRDGHSLKIGAGLHWLNVSATLSGEARINDTTREFRASRASAELPVPNIGAWYRYAASENWYLTARVDWLSASIDNYSGDIWNVAAGANYRLTEHVGVGLNYQYFQIAATLTEPNWRGTASWTFSGPFIYLGGYW